MNGREGCLAGNEDERAVLFQCAVGSTQQQVVGKAARNPCNSLHAARDDDHPLVPGTARRKRGGEIEIVVHPRRECCDLIGVKGRLDLDHPSREVRHDEVCLDAKLAGGLEETDPVNDAACTREGDDYAGFCHSGRDVMPAA